MTSMVTKGGKAGFTRGCEHERNARSVKVHNVVMRPHVGAMRVVGARMICQRQNTIRWWSHRRKLRRGMKSVRGLTCVILSRKDKLTMSSLHGRDSLHNYTSTSYHNHRRSVRKTTSSSHISGVKLHGETRTSKSCISKVATYRCNCLMKDAIDEECSQDSTSSSSNGRTMTTTTTTAATTTAATTTTRNTTIVTDETASSTQNISTTEDDDVSGTEALSIDSENDMASTTAPPIPMSPNTAAIVRVGSSKRYTDKDLLGDICKLAIPCLGVALADPVMSLIDTGCVGRISTIGLAALGPNTAIFNTVFQVCIFWGTATTNFIAGASPLAAGISVDERSRRREKGAELLSSALSMSFVKGMLLWAALYYNGEFLLRLMGANEELLGPALSYFEVRVAAAPAVLVTMVAQGACLGQQDAVSPLIVVLVSALVNLSGDFYLVLNKNMGVTGAAIATIVAQYIQAIVFLVILFIRGKLDTVSGIPLKFCGLPKWKTITRFADMAGVLASRTILQMMTYAFLTYSILVLGDNKISAAHQVALQLFWLISYFPDPLTVSAQTFIAKDISMPLKVHRTSWLLIKIGLAMGATLFMVSYVLTKFFCGAFSSDPSIIATASTLGIQMGVSACLVTMVMVLDGILIGSSDFGLMPLIGGISTALVLLMLRSCIDNGIGLSGMWWSLPLFFGTRVLLNVLKVVLKIGKKSPLLKPKTSPANMIASWGL